MENFATTLTSKLVAEGLIPAESQQALESLVAKTMAAAPKRQKRKVAQPLLPLERCMARVWGKVGDGSEQCSLRRKGGNDFCGRHGKQAAATEKPCQVDEHGNHVGLFNGRIDHELPWLGDDMTIRIEWRCDVHKAMVAQAIADGTAHRHPNARRRKPLALARHSKPPPPQGTRARAIRPLTRLRSPA